MDARYAVCELAHRHGSIEADIYGECRGSEQTLVRELTAGRIKGCIGPARAANAAAASKL